MLHRSSPAVGLPDIRRFRASIRRLQQLVKLRLRNCCRGVTVAQCHVLLELEAQGATTGGNLARELYLDKSTLSRTVDGLVKLGLIRRESHGTDRRVTILSVTPEGKRACDRLNSVNDELFQGIFARVPRQSRAAVIRNFVLFVDAFAGLEDACENRVSRSGSGGLP